MYPLVIKASKAEELCDIPDLILYLDLPPTRMVLPIGLTPFDEHCDREDFLKLLESRIR
jgi:hypothetical protein